MDPTYSRWVYHGEDNDTVIIEHDVEPPAINAGLDVLLADQVRAMEINLENGNGNGNANNVDAEDDENVTNTAEQKDTFYKLVKAEAERILYVGCTS